MTSRSAFNRPPMDGSLTVPEIYDWHYEHNKNHPMFIYEDEPGQLRSVSMGMGIQGMHRATQSIREHFGFAFAEISRTTTPTIAILAASDSITFSCTLIGALRAGVTVFLISPRNSASAVSFLLSEVKPTGILVSTDASLQKLADESIKNCWQPELRRAVMPTFEDLFREFDPHFDTVPPEKLDMRAPAIIYHSSGTGSFPRPIVTTHKLLFWISKIPLSGGVDMSGSILGSHCVAMFHAMGALPLVAPASVGVILAVFKPQAPAVIPNPNNVFEGSVATGTEFLLGPPTFYELWSQNPKYVESMSKMKGIVFGGGPLAKHAGDALASKGVNVFQIYASTETSLMNEFLPKNPGMMWDYFRFNPNIRVHLEPFGDNQYRVVAIAVDDYRPCVVNKHIDGSDAFATDDLVAHHPTKQGYYKVIGRIDDQIIHSNGEKTNAGPIEAILRQDPNIDRAVVFGRGRFQCGILVQPSKDYSIDPSDPSAVLEFRSKIWSSVEKANAFAPSHSRIFKEMILIASSTKPFEYTAKGSVRRQSVVDAYASEINAAYDAVEESAQPEIKFPSDWTRGSIIQFSRDVVARTMKKDVGDFGDDADLFEHGLDSLQATWIRNTFMRVLRESHAKLVHNVSPNFVYEHPTVALLTDYVHGLVAGKDISPEDRLDAKMEELLRLVKKYTGPFPEFVAVPRARPSGRVVLITGSTGSLGSNLLAKLLQSPSVDRVFALSRPSQDGSVSVSERLTKAFEREAFDEELLRNEKLTLLEGDPSRDDLGVSTEQFNELLSLVTHVIHNGWRVNFNNAVTSFESNIRSVRNFIDFCLRCKGEAPARLVFISSIGIFQQSNEVRFEEELNIEDVALGSGYGESKWVAEEILNKAPKQSASRIIIIRPGQITGGVLGTWNEREWFPSLVKTSVFLNELPLAEGMMSWITADTAAGAIIDMLDSDEHILHLVHPHPVKWSDIIDWFSKELRIPVVSSEEWMNDLEKSRSSLDSDSLDSVEAAFERNPALRLLDTLRAPMRKGGNNLEPSLASGKAQMASVVLQNAQKLCEGNVRSWISSWRKSGFL